MIALKYSKLKRARYISHIDVLRHLMRTMRRANIDVGFTEGFNPHMKIKLSSPCPLGISSLAEYMVIDCKIPSCEFLDLYNRYCLADLQGVNSWEVKKNPNFQGIVRYADYFVPIDNINNIKIKGILDKNELIINYKAKGKQVEKNIRPLIKDFIVKDEGLIMRLMLGNKTLRADILLSYLNESFNLKKSVTDIIRYNQYTVIHDKLVNFDEYLDNLIE